MCFYSYECECIVLNVVAILYSSAWCFLSLGLFVFVFVSNMNEKTYQPILIKFSGHVGNGLEYILDPVTVF